MEINNVHKVSNCLHCPLCQRTWVKGYFCNHPNFIPSRLWNKAEKGKNAWSFNLYKETHPKCPLNDFDFLITKETL